VVNGGGGCQPIGALRGTTVLHRMPWQANDGCRVIYAPAHLEGMPQNGGCPQAERPGMTN